MATAVVGTSSATTLSHNTTWMRRGACGWEGASLVVRCHEREFATEFLGGCLLLLLNFGSEYSVGRIQKPHGFGLPSFSLSKLCRSRRLKSKVCGSSKRKTQFSELRPKRDLNPTKRRHTRLADANLGGRSSHQAPLTAHRPEACTQPNSLKPKRAFPSPWYIASGRVHA